MPGTVLRPLSVADAPAVIDLVNAAAGQAERRAAMDASGRVRLYRRRGVGRALMTSALAEFWRRGVRRVVLDTDADNPTGAPRLYRQLGLRPYRHELVLEREVRPGREVRVDVTG